MNAIAPREGMATHADWSRFMRPVAAAVRNPPSGDDFKARVAAIASAVHVPAAWLAQSWRQTEAMRKFQFWPAVSDVYDLFAEDLRSERESADRRLRLEAPLPKDWPNFRTPEEILHVQNAAKQLVAELRHTRPEDKGPPPKALPLSDGDLLERYERLARDGNPIAIARVQHLRERMGIEA